MKPSDDLIQLASEGGHTDIVRLLLEDVRIDPSSQTNSALREAVENGFDDIVQLLLVDGRVINQDSIDENFFLLQAVIGSHYDTIRILLLQPELNPNHQFELACKVSRFDVVKLLFSDPRVDPSEDNNSALRIARVRRRADVIELLLSDQRVRDMENE